MRCKIVATVLAAAALALLVYLLRPDLVGREEDGFEQTERLLRRASGPAPARLPAPLPGGRAKSAVVMVGDGLGFAGIEAARLLESGIGGHLQLDRFPVAGWSSTRSAIAVVTDSAAGATAISTGHKTLNGSLAVDAEGRRLRTLAEAAKAQGKAVGLLTDSYMWDATPGAFAVHQKNRRKYLDIAQATADSGFDLLIGCEARRIEEDDQDGGPVVAHFKERGYAVGHDLDWLEQAGEGKALALLPGGSLTPEEGASQLARATVLALRRLAKAPDGFLLLVETEETDTGSHDHVIEQTMRGVRALDAALAEVFAFAEPDGGTLVLWTADHDTGGLAIVGGREGEPLRYVWATEGHNAEPVPLLAYGPGAEAFAGTRDNTEVARDVARALGLGWEAGDSGGAP
jgi:alkaline phosphatase